MHDNPPASTPAPPPRKGVRWWPLALILLLGLGAAAFLWLPQSPAQQLQDKVVGSFALLLFSGLAAFGWLLLLSRLRWRLRMAWAGTILLLLAAAGTTLRVRGVSGDFVPILEWRWSGGAPAEDVAPTDGTPPEAPEGLLLDWPRFLGPTGVPVAHGVTLERDWTAHPPRLLWRRPIGPAWSGFVVQGARAVTQEQREEQERVTCYALSTGRLLWSHADTARYARVISGTGPRATPTIHDGRVYTVGAWGRLNCLDLATGEVIWARDMLADAEAKPMEWGQAGSPLVADGRVVVNAGGTSGASLLAYDAQTGAPLWRAGSAQGSYASPMLTELAGRRQIVMLNHHTVTAHDPDDGSVLWETPWPGDQPKAVQPLAVGSDRLLVSSGYGVGCALYRIQAGTDGTLEAQQIWKKLSLKAKFANGVVHEQLVYNLDDGVLVCLDPETGRRRWKRGRYGHGQLILAGDLLLIMAENGDVALVEATGEAHRELGRFRALNGKTWNTPALAGQYLLVRNDREAACWVLPLITAAAASPPGSAP